jgi:hypothetical protein
VKDPKLGSPSDNRLGDPKSRLGRILVARGDSFFHPSQIATHVAAPILVNGGATGDLANGFLRRLRISHV